MKIDFFKVAYLVEHKTLGNYIKLCGVYSLLSSYIKRVMSVCLYELTFEGAIQTTVTIYHHDQDTILRCLTPLL